MIDSRSRWFSQCTLVRAVLLLLATCLEDSEALEIGCPNDRSIEGVATLADLREYMTTEFIASLTEPDLRGPPYEYILCPNTTYTVKDDNDIITPFLDGSVISCGIDGSSTNGCIVEGYNQQVRLQEQSTLPNRVRTTTVFKGITFQNSRQWSILAWDKAGTIASFNDCIWRGSQGERVIDIRYTPVTLNETAPPSYVPSVAPSVTPSAAPTETAESAAPTVEGDSLVPTVESASPSPSDARQPLIAVGMEIHLNDCVIEDSSSGPLSDRFTAILLQSSRLTLNNVVIRNIEGLYTILNDKSKVAAWNSTFQENTVEFVTVANVGESEFASCNFFDNTVGTGVIGATGATVSISRGDFLRNTGFVDIVSVTVGGEIFIPSVFTLEESCFEASMNTFGAVLAGEGTLFTWMDVFAANNDGERCPDGIFYEEESGSCVAPSGCIGVCEEFDLRFCPWRTSSSPSAEPSASFAPSSMPSLEPSTATPSATPNSPPSLRPSPQPNPEPTSQPTVNDTDPAVLSAEDSGGGGRNNAALIAGVTASVGIVLLGGVAGYLVFGRNV